MPFGQKTKKLAEATARNEQLESALDEAHVDLLQGAAALLMASTGLSEGMDNASRSLNDIASAAEQQSEGAQHVGEIATKVANTVTLITTGISLTAEAASEANERAIEMQSQSMEGIQTVEEITQAVFRVTESSVQVVQTLSGLNDLAIKLQDVARFQQQRIEQVEMLALNAQIEAARSHLPGFDVIAEQIKKYATDVKDEAVHAVDVLTAAASNIAKVLPIAQEATAVSEEGKALTEQALNHFASFVEATALVAQLMTGINDSLQKQSSQVQELQASTQELASVAEESAAAAEETASQTILVANTVRTVAESALELQNVADDLNSRVQMAESRDN